MSSFVNNVKTFFLMLFLSGLFLLVGSFFGESGLLFGFIFSIVANLISYFKGASIVLRTQRAVPFNDPEIKRLVHKLAVSAKIPIPKLYITETQAPNAFATGRNPKHGIVCVTRGIVNLLSLQELEAVLAHEIGHIKNRDMLIQTFVNIVVSSLMYLVTISKWALIFGGFGGGDRDRNPLELLILIILLPIILTILRSMISKSREFVADSFSVKLTKNKNAMISALRKIHGFSVKGQGNPMYFANIYKSNTFADLFSTHPTLDKRINNINNTSLI